MAGAGANRVGKCTVILKKERDRSVLQGNPWIFSGSIARVTGTTAAGEPCTVLSASGMRLGCGYYNNASAITVRMLAWGDEGFSDAMLTRRIISAVNLRRNILNDDTDSCRLVNSEGDFLPGLIVDKCSDGLVVQLLTAGMERMRDTVIAALRGACVPAFMYERSDTEARAREGLGEKEGRIAGTLPATVRIRENGLSFAVDIAGGQKTGYFFDQRENRRLCRSYAADRRVCDCFSYCGPFTVASLAGGARSVDAVDRSAPALELVKQNVAANGYDESDVTTLNADIFRFLRETDRDYDLIILDPPKFARHVGEVEHASRGYKDINLIACKKVRPGGLIFTFSCSHAIDIKLFRQIVFAAAADSGRRFQLLHTLSAGPDHPINLAHKEGEYLKGLVLRAEE
jgi:23S rRNA (cytosine1962-C5)-methyltransferase